MAGKTITETVLDTSTDDLTVVRKYLENLSDSYVFCHGINEEEYKTVCTNIHYESNAVIKMVYPCISFASKNCSRWYKLRHKATAEEHRFVNEGTNRCPDCNKAFRYLRRIQVQEVKKIGTPRKRRIEISSTYPITLLSPSSKKRRLHSINRARKYSHAKVERLKKKLQKYTVTLNDEQSEELEDFVTNHVTEVKLQEILAEGIADSGDAAQALREDFLNDQKKNGK